MAEVSQKGQKRAEERNPPGCSHGDSEDTEGEFLTE